MAPARWRRSPTAPAGLSFFVLYLALPALFFQLIAATPLGRCRGWSFVVTTTFATYCAFAIAFSIGALINGGNVPEATVEGLVGSYANIGILAPALTMAPSARRRRRRRRWSSPSTTRCCSRRR